MRRLAICAFFCATFVAWTGSLAQADLILNGSLPISYQLTVNPIIVSNGAGTQTATFMGTSIQEAAIKGFVNDIWAQAGIDIVWLSPQTINNTEIFDGSLGPNGNSPRPETDLSGDPGGNDHETLGAGVRMADTINMFFVNIPAGFSASDLDANTAAGYAEIPGDDISIFIGSSLVTFQSGQEVAAAVIAHEIGHNLGLDHITETNNLMEAFPGGERINSSQISTVLGSSLLTPVPEPSTWLLCLFAIGGLVWHLRRRRVLERGPVPPTENATLS